MINFQIVLFKNKKKRRIIKKYASKERAEEFYQKMIDKSDKVLFEKKVVEGKPINLELCMLQKKSNKTTPFFIRDEFGRNQKVDLDDNNYQIVKIQSFREPELIFDYQTKKKIPIEKFIKHYLSKDGLKMISKLNNKMIVQNEEQLSIFVLKNDDEVHRLFDELFDHFKNIKKYDCMFVRDLDVAQRKYLYDYLTQKGIKIDYLYRKETTYPVT
jgi:hypothetical protein